MQLPQILFIVFAAMALGGAVTAAVLRRAFHAALALAGSCLGVTGLLALLGAPVLAALQALLFAGGVAILVRFAPPPLKEMTRPPHWGFRRPWWVTAAAGVAAAALCGAIAWAVFRHAWGQAAEFNLVGSLAALGTALIDPAGFLFPLIAAAVLLVVALVGAVKIARRT